MKINQYVKMLHYLRQMQDPMQATRMVEADNGRSYLFIETAGHGYLVVPKDDLNFGLALGIVNYGYYTHKAIFLEEDNEAPKFLESLKNLSVTL
jgi:hypothetical protein